MREKLKVLEGERKTFTAVFVRYGQKSGYKGPVETLLFNNIMHNGQEVSDHLWFTTGKRFQALGLEVGDLVQFDARVTNYVKGYKGNQDCEEGYQVLDWRLSWPSNLKVLKHIGGLKDGQKTLNLMVR